MLIQRLPNSNADRQKKLQKLDASKIIKYYMFHSNRTIKYSAKATLINLTGRDVEVQIDFFGHLNVNALISEALDVHEKFQRKEILEGEFFNNQHLQ